MLQQIFLDTRYANQVFENGSHVFWLPEILYLPRDAAKFRIRLVDTWIPVTFYSVFERNDTLSVRYDGGPPETYTIPHGNYPIDVLLEGVNLWLDRGWTCSYNDFTNKITFSNEDPLQTLQIVSPTTCQKLLGVLAGDVSVDGGYTPRDGVDMTRTSSIFIRSNLIGSNRDPFTRRGSDILAKIPLTKGFNEIEHVYDSPWVNLGDQSISYIILGLFDDDMINLDLNGARFSVTIQIDLIMNNEQERDSQRKAEDKRQELRSGRPNGDSQPDTESRPKKS